MVHNNNVIDDNLLLIKSCGAKSMSSNEGTCSSSRTPGTASNPLSAQSRTTSAACRNAPCPFRVGAHSKNKGDLEGRLRLVLAKEPGSQTG